jgi:membrane protein DedA with SNARE-associated domain
MNSPLAIFGFFYGLGIVLWLLNLLSIIWVIYDALTKQKKMPDVEKVIWIIVVLFLGIIGAIIYYIVVKASHKYEEQMGGEYETSQEPPVY